MPSQSLHFSKETEDISTVCRCYLFIFKNIYLPSLGLGCSMWVLQALLWHAEPLVAARELLVVAFGIQFPDQEGLSWWLRQ